MARFASFSAFAAFLTIGLNTALYFAGEPASAEQIEKKEKKDMNSPKANDGSKKKDMGGK